MEKTAIIFKISDDHVIWEKTNDLSSNSTDFYKILVRAGSFQKQQLLFSSYFIDFYIPDFPIQFTESNKNEVCFFYSGEDSRTFLPLIKSILKAFNKNFNQLFKILVPEKFVKLCASESNDNIKVLAFHERDIATHLSDAKLVIASGVIVLQSLLNNIPTIVAGDYGFGGMITDKNVSAQLHNGFSGRIGAYLGEFIPATLLQHSINDFIDNTLSADKPYLSEESIKILYSFYETKKETQQIIKWISYGDRIQSALRSSTNSVELIPVVQNDISIMTIGNTCVAKNRLTEKIVGILESDELSVLNMCNGLRSLNSIAAALDLEVDELKSFMHSLWLQRIIGFN